MAQQRFTATAITPSSVRPRVLYEYYVTGRGVFPVDMLRYDQCWPASSADAAKIDHDNNNQRSLKMQSYKEPTIARWNSFVWSVGIDNLERLLNSKLAK